MRRHGSSSMPSGGSSRARDAGSSARVAIVVLAAIAAWMILPSSPALADGGEEEDLTAATLVERAIEIIRAQPELTAEAGHMISDALADDETEGVDLDVVRQAQAALEAGDLSKTELLLEQAVGTGATPLVSPAPVPAHIREIDSSPVGGTQAVLLLGAALVVAVAGATVVRRFR